MSRYYSLIKRLLKTYVFNRHVTPKKFMNLVLIAFQHGFIKNSRVLGYPTRLVIEPINICNLKCPLCPTGQGNKAQPRGKIRLSDFKLIINELGDYLYEIDLFNWGEPFLNPEIYSMVSYARSKNIRVKISTNFNTLKPGEIKKIVKSGLSSIIISLDGASQESLDKYRTGSNFEKVILNIRALVLEKKKQNSRYPKIIWQFLIMKHNEHEIDKAKKIAEQLGIEIEFRPVRTDLGKEIFENDKKKIEDYKEWLPSRDIYSRFDYKNKKRKVRIKTCMFLWTQSAIGWDGEVFPCCAVYDYKYSFGNMFKEGRFKNVWNNYKYKEARKMVRTRKITDSSIVCGPCMVNGFIDF
ncbi:MAG: radical SAM protein [Candidatus Nanoarchaeia archaeon]|nr:radical SAM protein [Candidatus Nanoarchaeia archaeon]MDD5741450.1 radical SAM protein [Candidatus Nanoarchaeia archaeon]